MNFQMHVDADPNTGRRARNPRREALRVLKLMAKDVGAMVSTWNQAQSTYDREDDATGTARRSNVRRPLRPDERRENSAEEWDRLARYMGWMARAAMDVGQFAEKMALRVRAGERW